MASVPQLSFRASAHEYIEKFNQSQALTMGAAAQDASPAQNSVQSYGFLRGLLRAFAIPFDRIEPRQWQDAMECRTGGDKNISKAKAQQLWPELKITHAIADALLLAECCRRKFIEL